MISCQGPFVTPFRKSVRNVKLILKIQVDDYALASALAFHIEDKFRIPRALIDIVEDEGGS